MKKSYVVTGGAQYTSEVSVLGIFLTKKKAVSELRKAGYKYSKKEDLFLTDRLWADIEPMEVDVLCGA